MKISPFLLAATTIGLGCASVPTFAEHRGIAIQPGKDGRFTYQDDFKTAKFLDDAFLHNLKVDSWQAGCITNQGPNRDRRLTYRFYGDHAISGIDVRVVQTANGKNLGGVNRLYLSSNGLDWTEVASSQTQKPNQGGWQSEPLAVTPQQAAAFVRRPEVWIRVVLDNFCGLKTGMSNRISSIAVKLELGEKSRPGDDPQAAERAAWGRLRRRLGWRCISVDAADPVDQRPPHYYEDVDGWLQEPNASPVLTPDERDGFQVRRACGWDRRCPLALAAFVKTKGSAGAIMARITVRSTRETSRKMNVLWDGKRVATFDAACYFDADAVFYVKLPGPPQDGVHELRIAGGDSGVIQIRQIAVAGEGEVAWAQKPRSPNGGPLEVLGACYLPDPLPPPDSQAVEGRTDKKAVGLVFRGMQRLYAEHVDFGALRLVLRNNGRVPVRIGNRLQLNGKPIEANYVDFAKSAWDAPGVVWYRVRPRLVEPGQCSEITVRFRRRPPGDRAIVTASLENGPAQTVEIPYRDLGLIVDYVTPGRRMDMLYVYVRKTNDAKRVRVTALFLDGKHLPDAKIHGADLPGNVALIVAQLAKPLEPYQYHVVGVKTDAIQETSLAAQFRVLPFVFPRGSIHTPPQLCKSMNMNAAMWRMVALETCEKHNLMTTCHQHGIFDVHRRVSHIFGPDEPDAHDNRGGGYDRGLGWHARRLAHVGWQELVERFAPRVATWLIMNGTVRPMNWFVYGQLADVSCFDPYPVTYYGADHAYVWESLSLARRCGAPRRMYACLEAYGWKGGQGVPKKARGPIPAEYRQNVVQAIGAGMKGLTSWVYSSGAGGWQLNEPVAKEIARLNALIKHIEGDLLLGTPIDLATTDAGSVPTGTVGKEKWPKPRVRAHSLLCGPDAIVLAVVNHIPASKPDPPRIEPAKDVTIAVRLPDFLAQVTAFEVTEDGVRPFACNVIARKAVLKLPSIVSGRVFVLRRPKIR